MAAAAVSTFSLLGQAGGTYGWRTTTQCARIEREEADVRIRLRMIARAWESASHHLQVGPEPSSSAVIISPNLFSLEFCAHFIPSPTPQNHMWHLKSTENTGIWPAMVATL
ncbi:hypothetical protein CGRA01v4_10209 [Colletotrichum graminicola]|nr:hypothetical protein CGRA01v4_10209 [Colletotrichum graminicola]